MPMASIGSLCRAVLNRPAMTTSRLRPILASAASDRALRIAGRDWACRCRPAARPAGPAACSRPRSAGAARRPAADGRPAARRVGVRPRWPGCAGRLPRRAAPFQLARQTAGGSQRGLVYPFLAQQEVFGGARRHENCRRRTGDAEQQQGAPDGGKPSGGGGAAVRFRHFSSKAPVFRPVCEHLRDFEHHAGLLRGIIFACNIRSASDHHQQGVRWGRFE